MTSAPPLVIALGHHQDQLGTRRATIPLTLYRSSLPKLPLRDQGRLRRQPTGLRPAAVPGMRPAAVPGATANLVPLGSMDDFSGSPSQIFKPVPDGLDQGSGLSRPRPRPAKISRTVCQTPAPHGDLDKEHEPKKAEGYRGGCSPRIWRNVEGAVTPDALKSATTTAPNGGIRKTPET